MSTRTAPPLLLVAAILFFAASAFAEEIKTVQDLLDRANSSSEKSQSAETPKAPDQTVNNLTLSASDYNSRGRALADQGKYDEAIKNYNWAILLDPKFAPAYSFRGLAHLEKGMCDLALQDEDRAIKMAPDQALLYLNRAKVCDHYWVAKYDQAMKDCNRAIELDPKLAPAYVLRGMTYHEKGASGQNSKFFDLAIKDFDQAIALDPKLAQAYTSRGVTYSWMGQHDRYMKDTAQALALDPDNAVLHNNYGGGIYQQKARPAADQAARLTIEAKSLTGSGSQDAAQAKRAEAAELTKKANDAFDEAEAHFAKAIELKPGYADALSNLGMITFERHGGQDVSFAPIASNPEIARKQAISLGSALTGKEPAGFQKSELCYLIALAVKADHPGALNNIGNLYRSMSQQAEAQGNLDDAKRYRKAAEQRYRAAVLAKPDLLEAHANLAVFLEADYRRLAAEARKLKDTDKKDEANTASKKSDAAYNEAVSEYHAASQINPKSARVHGQLAMLLFERNRYAEALPEFKAAFRLGDTLPQALASAALILATASDEKLRDGAQAINLAGQAVQMTKHQFPPALDTLAAAYAEAGHFDDAVRTEQQALDLAQAAKTDQLVPIFRQHLQLYKDHKPLRTPATPPPQ